MNKLGIDPDKYKNLDEQLEKFSFVLINPPSEFVIKPGDIVYLLKPGTPFQPKETSASNSNLNLNYNKKQSTNQLPTNLFNIDEESPVKSSNLIEAFSLPTLIHSIDEAWEECQSVNTNCNESKYNYKRKHELFNKKLTMNNLKKVFQPINRARGPKATRSLSCATSSQAQSIDYSDRMNLNLNETVSDIKQTEEPGSLLNLENKLKSRKIISNFRPNGNPNNYSTGIMNSENDHYQSNL